MPDKKKIAANRKALRDYLVEDRIEAGIALCGTEVKSVKAGNINLIGSYATIERGECILRGVNISPYEYGNRFNHEPERPRRLLLHTKEISRLRIQSEQKGYALIPLNVYLKRGLVKIDLGICRGKKQVDKRETMKRRDADMDTQRAIRRHAGR